MKITEKYVNESQIDEITQLVQKGRNTISLDKEDVKNVLVGKEGILYQAYQEEGIENSTFMKDVFDTLKEREEVKYCSCMLISIGMSSEDPMTMEDVEIIQNFFTSIHNEKMELKWGIKYNSEGERMSILTLCTKVG